MFKSDLEASKSDGKKFNSILNPFRKGLNSFKPHLNRFKRGLPALSERAPRIMLACGHRGWRGRLPPERHGRFKYLSPIPARFVRRTGPASA